MKIVLGPMNYSGQPWIMAEELRRRNIDALMFIYANDGHKSQGFKTHETITPDWNRAHEAQLKTLKKFLRDGTDIFHFWNRSMVFQWPMYKRFMGLDIPLIKARGRKIVYRFTGNDIRVPSLDMKVNPYSMFKYGYKNNYKERDQLRYIDFLQEYVDQFLVQDPELLQFFPEAKMVPRALELDQWPVIGVKEKDEPLVIHAPTSRLIKGTDFILRAVEDLKHEGLKFRFKLLENLKHEELRKWQEQADIGIDNLHQGCLCVFAMEIMALGKPALIYIREDLYNPVYGEVPVFNCNPDNIKEVLKQAIQDFDLRKELGGKSRKYLETHHATKVMGDKILDIYNDVMAAESTRPTGYGDINYFVMQLNSVSRRSLVQDLQQQSALYVVKLIVREVMRRVKVKFSSLLGANRKVERE